jgi:hypothetical protein
MFSTSVRKQSLMSLSVVFFFPSPSLPPNQHRIWHSKSKGFETFDEQEEGR